MFNKVGDFYNQEQTKTKQEQNAERMLVRLINLPKKCVGI